MPNSQLFARQKLMRLTGTCCQMRIWRIANCLFASGASDPPMRLRPAILSGLRRLQQHRWRISPKDNNFKKTGEGWGRDATHRARQVDTHPTHGCITAFCGFGEMLIASRGDSLLQTCAFPPFFAMADSIAIGAKR